MEIIGFAVESEQACRQCFCFLGILVFRGQVGDAVADKEQPVGRKGRGASVELNTLFFFR